MKTFANNGQQAALVSGVNIKTINGDSILWSWNLVVSWGGGWGGFEPTELGGDANIWELSEWVYTTVYNLYYKSWSAVPAAWSLSSKKQMLFVVEESTGEKWFFVFAESHASSTSTWRASFGTSTSSSEWKCYQLGSRDWSLKHYWYLVDSTWQDAPVPLSWDSICQVIEWIRDNVDYNVLSISNSNNPPYPWLTYTVVVNSVEQWETYTMWLWTWVTNPLNIALPSNSNKKCVITLLITSTTSAIITGCTIQN
jgi:hypothetical protein